MFCRDILSAAWCCYYRARQSRHSTYESYGPPRFGQNLVGLFQFDFFYLSSYSTPRSWHISICLAYLPAWVIVALIWHYRIFSKTNAGLVVVVHLLLGLSLASWSFFVAAPFGKSPQLAAVASTFLAILFAIIALVLSHAGNVAAFIFTILFPPGYYIFAIRAMCGFENNLLATNVLQGDPDNGLLLLPLLIAAIVSVFILS